MTSILFSSNEGTANLLLNSIFLPMDKTKGEKERKKEDSRFVQSARIEKLRGETLIEIAASSPPPKLLINHFVSDGDVEGKKRAIMDPADYSRISLRSIVNDIASDERDDERSSPPFFAS